VVPADKDNVTVVLVLQTTIGRRAPLSLECKTMLLLKKSSVSEDVCQQFRPQGSRPPEAAWVAKDPQARGP
jgi:hypothetical protein